MEDSAENVQRDFGPQPLDRFLEEYGLSNRDLVEASTEQLTHKQVQRARKGRRLTRNMQEKVARAYAAALAEKGMEATASPDQLFTYRP